MSDKKKRKDKSAKKGAASNDSNKLSKEEDSIARFVRFNCPTNVTMFEGNEVHYFSGKKAVDLLIDSKKYGAKAKKPKFEDVRETEEFLQMLLDKGLFFRARKIVLKKKDKSQELKPEKSRDASKSPKSSKKNKNRDEELNEEKGGDLEEDKKKKKKVKLVFNEVQTFEIDTNDVYAWVFDPTPFWKKCVGILIVFGTIGGCLFPLWPEWLRLVVYYLSVTGIALFGLLLGVALARTILYALIWLFTIGRHHLWILPNLMEDCGFFESFQPFYTYEYSPGGFFAKNEQKMEKKKNDENEKDEEKNKLIQGEEGMDDKGENEDESSTAEDEEQNVENEEEENDKEEGKEENVEDEEGEGEEAQSDSNSNSWERLSENSQKSAECKKGERKNE